jgi:DNA-binding response OmpR family regulator
VKDNIDILVVDDDENICQLVRLYLEKENFSVECVHNGNDALRAFEKLSPKLIVLDIMLPGISGWEVCREVRKTSTVPIIMLTAKGETFDKVLGLELGADDYITKPFEPQELVARVKAVIRRTQPREEAPDALDFKGLRINRTNYTVTFRNEAMELPPKEMELLWFLAKNVGRVFSREQLLEKVWGYEYFGDARTVDVHVKRLREKLGISEQTSWEIKTVWGVGYKFEVVTA